jgi:AcrR family transcriptional regulator
METKIPVPRPGGRSARVRTAVVEAALDELVERGYADMTIEGIAARAGVNKTSIYRRWGSKGALLADALLASTAATPVLPAGGDLRHNLLLLWATAPRPRHRRDYARPIAVSRALLAAASDPDVAEAHRELWRRRLEVITLIVKRAVATGELREGADPALLMDLLFGPFHSRVIARDQRPDTTFLITIMESAIRAVGGGVPRA